MSVKQLTPSEFNQADVVKWFGPTNNFGDDAKLDPNAYVSAAGKVGVSVIKAAPTQNVTVSVCSALGLRCNIEPRTGLLLATNVTASPLRLRFAGNGVKQVGAFVVSSNAAFGTPFTAQMWVLLANAATWVSVPMQGVTGDIWQRVGDSVAPFVGAIATDGDLITEVHFDAVHPTTQEFSPIGIGNLYCV